LREESQPSGPLVLKIRVRGRLIPFSAILLLFALLPGLASSSPQNPKASVVLAAGDHAAVQDAVSAVDAASAGLSDAALGDPAPASTAAGSAFADAIGGGLFMFPAIELTPITAEALVAPLLGGVTFIHPVPGGESSPFGPRMHPVLGRPMFHTGIDLAAACGTPIRAAAAGTVVYAEVSPSWGLRTIIEHTPSLKTAYGHQSKFLVKEGDVVKQGQIIGLVGTTGWSTGCHLHFDVILNDRYVDPAPYLGFPPSNANSVPFGAVPHVVLGPNGNVVHTVEDGDVPLPDAGPAPVGTPTSSPSGTPSSRPTTPPTTGPTGSPTTRPTPSPTGTTTSTPPTTTTTDPGTTITPPTSTTSDPTTTTADPAPTTSDSSTSPTPTETLTTTATEVLATGTAAATTAAAADATTSDPTRSDPTTSDPTTSDATTSAP
jgi:murein DD-endopeptidase MepM/ murein hydrolase activator NlpD